MPIAIVRILHKSLTVLLSLSQDGATLLPYSGNILPIGGCDRSPYMIKYGFSTFCGDIFLKEKTFFFRKQYKLILEPTIKDLNR